MLLPSVAFLGAGFDSGVVFGGWLRGRGLARARQRGSAGGGNVGDLGGETSDGEAGDCGLEEGFFGAAARVGTEEARIGDGDLAAVADAAVGQIKTDAIVAGFGDLGRLKRENRQRKVLREIPSAAVALGGAG